MKAIPLPPPPEKIDYSLIERQGGYAEMYKFSNGKCEQMGMWSDKLPPAQCDIKNRKDGGYCACVLEYYFKNNEYPLLSNSDKP